MHPSWIPVRQFDAISIIGGGIGTLLYLVGTAAGLMRWLHVGMVFGYVLSIGIAVLVILGIMPKRMLQKVGSNRLLRAETLAVEFKKPWNLLAQTTSAATFASDDSSRFQIWCRREDLNLHGLPRLLLRQVRLPISPPRHIRYLTGASSRDRTYDLILKRDLLYQLSYGRIIYLLILYKKYNRNIVI